MKQRILNIAALALLFANSEQYRTTNLVSAPRTITVSMSGNYNSNMSTALDNCIARYNAQNLGITFTCVSSAATNEGDGGVGAIHIPGTPTGPDAASWMLACIGNGVDRPFNANDVTALNYLY